MDVSAKIGLSIPEACAMSSLARSSIYRLISDGKLEARRVGGRRIILAASLRRLIEGDAA